MITALVGFGSFMLGLVVGVELMAWAYSRGQQTAREFIKGIETKALQRVEEIGRQQTQAAKMAEKQATTPEQTQRRTPRQAQ